MKRLYIISLLLGLYLWVPLASAQAATLAFPTAEGFGKFAQGGRGGRVIEVITLNCSGPGSFLEALQAAGPRTVVFKVGGIIDCSSRNGIRVSNPYLTIAGQTAPGDGILLKGVSFDMRAHNTIIRYMRFRVGENIASNPSSGNALGINYTHDVIVDHVSVSWATDDIAHAFESDNTTWQRSIISEGLHCAVPGRSYCHGKGMVLGYNSPVKVSVHHNLFANSADRNPTIGTGTADMINNVLHKVAGAPLFNPYWASARLNYVGNYYTDSGAKYLYQVNRFIGQGVAKYTTKSLVYPKGNIHPVFRPDNSRPETDIMYFTDPPFVPLTATRIPTISYPSETDAFQAYHDVLADVGDNKRLNADGTFSPRIGPVDARIINEVKTGGGKNIRNSLSEVGGFPVLRNGTPYLDTDKDGMPDVWEDKWGFDKFDPTDGNKDSNGDGYTNLEEFLNGTYPLPKNTPDTTPPASPKGVKIF